MTITALPNNHRILLSLALTQAFNMLAVPISFLVATLTIVELANGNSAWTGVPGALTTVGSAVAAYFVGRRISNLGYRKLLFIAAALGMLGSMVAGFSSWQRTFFPFLCAFLFLGMAIGLISLSRYAAVETSEPKKRAQSLGRVVIGSTLGAISGPLLVQPSGVMAVALGLPILFGPWLAIFMCFLSLFFVNYFLLRPEPKNWPSPMNEAQEKSTKIIPDNTPNQHSSIFQSRILLPLLAMMAAQIAMVLIMTITPLHMRHCYHPVNTISIVIMAHFLGMFGLSPFSGWIADRLGRMATIGLGGLLLTISCILAIRATQQLPLILVLFLLGLGWSFCFIGGSSALSEALSQEERGKILGITEAIISISSGIASLSSGILFATFSFPFLAMVGISVSILPTLIFCVSRRKSNLVSAH